jgi:hypothetical protein
MRHDVFLDDFMAAIRSPQRNHFSLARYSVPPELALGCPGGAIPGGMAIAAVRVSMCTDGPSWGAHDVGGNAGWRRLVSPAPLATGSA